MTESLIDTTAAAPTPEGFRETNSGIIVPEEFSREKQTLTEEDAKILEKATRIANTVLGWTLTFGCPHARCRAQPIVEGIQTGDGQLLRCGHKEVHVRKPLPGKPNAAILRRQQSRQAKLEEQVIVPAAKRINAEEDAKAKAERQTGQVDGETA